MKIHVVHPEDHDYVEAVASKVMAAYDGRGIEWKHPVGDPELWKLNSGQRAGVVGVELKGRRCCAKLFYDGRLRAHLRNLAGFPKAKRAFCQATKLQRRGIRCPDMMGLVSIKPTGPYLVVSELCDYAMRTDHYIIQNGITAELVRDFASFVSAMHDKGVSHTDFSLRNTLIVPHDDKSGYRFLLLDYEDARIYPKLSRGIRQENLHHLLERALKIVPFKWRVLFLKAYLQDDTIREWIDDLNALLKKHPSKYTRDIAL
jgi:tRNA A-37 threonylcarbamoyl transferase component Bud32